ncbi:MAG: winged helix-turn-helix transcriptional regulator [Chromatiaceae bacterium]|nr:winged helix-turn-helix transcriptional regulator [Chromatiaceae bacterium]
MTVSVQVSSQEFLYDQVIRHVRGLVEAGTLKPGDRAPSLRAMSRQLRVSISTVSQAYAALQDLGVLRVRPQSGYYVDGAAGRPQDSPVPRKTAVSQQPRKVRFGELFEEIFSVANDPEVVPLRGRGTQCRTDAGKGCAAGHPEGRRTSPRTCDRLLLPARQCRTAPRDCASLRRPRPGDRPRQRDRHLGLQRGPGAESAVGHTAWRHRRGRVTDLFLGTAADRAYGAAGGRDRFRSGDRDVSGCAGRCNRDDGYQGRGRGAEFQQSARLADAR